MDLRTLLSRYQKHYASLAGAHGEDRAAELAVGGDFEAVGMLEYFVLKAAGLTGDMFVLDVGCGTGRLAHQLAKRGHARYAGYDIVESAVEHARKLCAMPGWTFGVTEGVEIALPAGSVDLACFFSVFTHIQHEHVFLYLKEMHRLLRPGGLVVFTFLEFRIPSHWTMFEAALRNFASEGEPIVFIDRFAIGEFSRALGYDIASVQDGDKPTIPIEGTIRWENGIEMTGMANLGQSICVLKKR